MLDLWKSRQIFSPVWMKMRVKLLRRGIPVDTLQSVKRKARRSPRQIEQDAVRALIHQEVIDRLRLCLAEIGLYRPKP